VHECLCGLELAARSTSEVTSTASDALRLCHQVCKRAPGLYAVEAAVVRHAVQRYVVLQPLVSGVEQSLSHERKVHVVVKVLA
jgi:hypothetical protein